LATNAVLNALTVNGVVNATGNVIATGGVFNALTVNGVVNASGNVIATGGVFNALTVNGVVNASGNILAGFGVFNGLTTNNGLTVNGGQINTTGNVIATGGVFNALNVNGPLITAGARIVAGYQYSNVLANVGITIGNSVERLVLDPTQVISDYVTVILPSANVDATLVTVSTTQTIQFLNVVANPGTTLLNSGNITLAAGTKAEYFYHAVESKWYKVG
jgi:hypothetical protein